eukprot:jgi/Botrbrau1/13901/Bobra.0017s0008.1
MWKSRWSPKLDNKLLEVHEIVRAGYDMTLTTNSQKKHAAYKKSKDLWRRFNVCMEDDLTLKQRAARAALQPQVTALRKEGSITFWRGEYLFKVKGQGPPVKVLPGVFAAHPSAPPTTTPSAPQLRARAHPLQLRSLLLRKPLVKSLFRF